MIKVFDEQRCIWNRRSQAMARFAAWMSVILLAASDGASLARASGLVIEVPNVSAKTGSSGSFDVLLADTDPVGTAGYFVAADTIGFSIVGSNGVSFTNATINTSSAPYIFVDSSTLSPPGTPLSLSTFPNTSFTTSDAEFASPGFRLVNPGDVFGLMNVSYTVSATAPSGSFPLAVDTSGKTSFSDELGNSIPFSVQGGSFWVTCRDRHRGSWEPPDCFSAWLPGTSGLDGWFESAPLPSAVMSQGETSCRDRARPSQPWSSLGVAHGRTLLFSDRAIDRITHARLGGNPLKSGLLSLQIPWMAGCKLNGEERIGLVIGCEEGAGSCAEAREGSFIAS
jgi:hypothetical protein